MFNMSLKRSLRSSTRATLDSTIITTGAANESPSVVSKPKTSVRQRSSKNTESNRNDGPTAIDSPSTPPAKRAKRAESSPTNDDPEAQLSDRPAEPHRTNATLKTPGGSRLVPFSKGVVDSSPIKGGLLVPTTTTRQLLDQAYDTIAFTVSSGETFPKPGQIVTCSIPFLQTAGLSKRKAEYIKGLAEKFQCGGLSAHMLMKASDEEVLEKLVAVRGLGRWSVEMFACFGLKRMDVLSTGDLGVQRGMAAFIGKDVKKLKSKGGKWKYLSEKEMVDISAPFAPYRSLFMWYMIPELQTIPGAGSEWFILPWCLSKKWTMPARRTLQTVKGTCILKTTVTPPMLM
ncbi:DNA-3-methyladenine glycosylase [Physcia stellaris]|nr:DNA-3-methyladenine glycosylase [Physcia stellaris]